MFGEGKALGKRGLRWLKIHLSNLCGVDKVSFDDRERYADEHLHDIFDSAEKPLDGNRWWLKAEEPWQCLGVCFALHEAYQLEDPTKYICHLPVAQDGTCNGLQHYAALGGDMMGAQQVNLVPSDRPSDVYTGVADLVKEAIRQDAEGGNEMAILLKDLITRKVVKQTVMTNVYGVTFIGAKAQIASQLKEIESLKEYAFSESLSRAVMAGYIAKKVFDSVQTMFSGANMIQNWLGTCAKRISLSISPTQMDSKLLAREDEEVLPRQKKVSIRGVKGVKGVKNEDTKADKKGVNSEDTKAKKKKKKEIEFMTSVVWTTPLKLPVVQPYRHGKVQVVSTNLQNVYITDPTVVDEINSRKQMTAFPPNFIHSLDATHMLLSASKCSKAGLTFASVHDSFWTHPRDVDQLNQILREAFIELHSGNVMNNLKDEFKVRYKGYRFLQAIPNDYPITAKIKALRAYYAKEVLRKANFGGKTPNLTMEEDLEWERSRDRLLNSSDEAERARGQAMITPSVLVQSEGLIKNEIEKHLEDDIDPEHTPQIDHEVTMDSLEAILGGEHVEEIDPLEFTDEKGETRPEAEARKQKKKLASQHLKMTNVWMPLEFPPLPEKVSLISLPFTN